MVLDVVGENLHLRVGRERHGGSSMEGAYVQDKPVAVETGEVREEAVVLYPGRLSEIRLPYRIDIRQAKRQVQSVELLTRYDRKHL